MLLSRTQPAAIMLVIILGATTSCGPGDEKKSAMSPPAKAAPEKKTAKAAQADKTPEKAPPKGPFGLSMVNSFNGKPLSLDGFASNEQCAECHPRQAEELKGSMHTIAHTDILYRSAAELALKEAGQEVYTYCSGCHSPHGVSSGAIPKHPESELPAIAKQGILCDVCHQISELTGTNGPWGEPGNASFKLHPDDDRKFGPPTGDDGAADHTVVTKAFQTRSEYCASCHTVIHPLNGVRIEHTYGEWKNSIYDKKGIQCQDCHMQSPKVAKQVALKMEPQKIMGKSTEDGKEREIFNHKFQAANINAQTVGGTASHGALAEEMIKNAAKMGINAPASVKKGGKLTFSVQVQNQGAGHGLPTSLTEYRQIWVELQVIGKGKTVLFQSGALEANGDIPKDAMWFGALAGDKDGNVTYKPWEITQFLYKRLIAPKATETDHFEVMIPANQSGKLRIQTKLFYRGIPPKVAKLLLGDKASQFKQLEMTSAEAMVKVTN